MDMKVYKKTRYQNIYKHKNGNYVVSINKPVKTTISRIDDKKIYDINDAIKIRDNANIRQQKAVEVRNKETFDTLWDKYMFECKNIKKLAYNTLIRKEKDYNKYLKNKVSKPVSKTDKIFWAKFIDSLNCSNKQKNHIIKILKAFFYWCIDKELLMTNPICKIEKYRVTSGEMKYWLPNELKKFLNTVKADFNNKNIRIRLKAHRVYALTALGFILGNRVGETRALNYKCNNKEKGTCSIKYSINYDTAANVFISSTKTRNSERIVDVPSIFFDIIEEYKFFLINEVGYDVKEDDLIFLNYKTGKPYSDTNLRKDFNYYIEKAGVPKIRMYDLRHTYVATMMSEGKEAYLFSQRIGHKNIQTTINVYGHLSEKIRKEVAQSTNKYI